MNDLGKYVAELDSKIQRLKVKYQVYPSVRLNDKIAGLQAERDALVPPVVEVVPEIVEEETPEPTTRKRRTTSD